MSNTIKTNTTKPERTTTIARIYVGIDISKNELVADLPEGKYCAAQTAIAMDALIKKLPANAHVVCEATGGYEKALLRALHDAGITVSCVMPWRVRAYAISQGILAKNDRIDAGVLSQYGRHTENLRLDKPVSQNVQSLRELLRARDNLVDLIKLERSHAEHPGVAALVREQALERLALYQNQQKQIEQNMRALIAEDTQMKTRSEKARQIKGVGEVVIWNALAEMPELGSLGKGQAGYLLGVAPLCDQSGTHNGARRIGAGRPRPRRVFYMAAISASQHNAKLSAFYQRLIAKGKAGKVALVAVMRKLVELLNKVFADPNFVLVQ